MSKRTWENAMEADEEPRRKNPKIQTFDDEPPRLPAELKHIVYENLVDSNPHYLRDVANLRLVSKDWGRGFERYLYHKLYFRLTPESIENVIRLSKHPKVAATVQYLVMEIIVFRFLKRSEYEGLSNEERQMYADWKWDEPYVSTLNLEDLDDYHQAWTSRPEMTPWYISYRRQHMSNTPKDEYHCQLLRELCEAIPRFRNLKGIETVRGFRSHGPNSTVKSPQELTQSLREAATAAAGNSKAYAEYMWKSGLAKNFVDFDIEPMTSTGQLHNHRQLLFWMLHIAHERIPGKSFSELFLRPLGRHPEVGFLDPGRNYPTLRGVRTLRLEYHGLGKPLRRRNFRQLFRVFPNLEHRELSGYDPSWKHLFDIRAMPTRPLSMRTETIRSKFPALKCLTLSNVLLSLDILGYLVHPEVELKLHNIHYDLLQEEYHDFLGIEQIDKVKLELSGIHKASSTSGHRGSYYIHPRGAFILDTKDARVGVAEEFCEKMYQRSRQPFRKQDASRAREDDYTFGGGFVDVLDPTKLRNYLAHGVGIHQRNNPFRLGSTAMDYGRYIGLAQPDSVKRGDEIDRWEEWRWLRELPHAVFRPLHQPRSGNATDEWRGCVFSRNIDNLVCSACVP